MLWSLSLRRASGTFFSGGCIAGLAVCRTGDSDGLAGCVGFVSISDGGSGAALWSSPRTGVLPAGVLGLQACGVPCWRAGVSGSGALLGWHVCNGRSLAWFAGVEASGAFGGRWV